MNQYAVATTLIKKDLVNANILTDLRLINAEDESDAAGRAMMQALQQNPDYQPHLRPLALLVTEELITVEPRKQYEEETGRGCLAVENGGVTGAYTADYVYWLESKPAESDIEGEAK